MALIIYLARSELSRAALESGTGALQTGELGFNEDVNYLEGIFKKRGSSGFLHFPSWERLAINSSAAASGAKGIGYFPAAGLSSTNIQDAIDELRSQVSGGGGGTVLGTMTAGKIPKALNSTTVTDSILSEASSKILFSGDSVANLYRLSSGILTTDGGLVVGQAFNAGGILTASSDLIANTYIGLGAGYAFDNLGINNTGLLDTFFNVTKNNSNSRSFYAHKILANLNAGVSNANTVVELLLLDTINNSLTGLTVNLINAKFNGSSKFKVASNGDITAGGGAVLGGDLFLAPAGIYGGSSRSISAPVNNDYHNLLQATFNRNVSGSLSHHLFGLFATLNAGGSNAGETLNMLYMDATVTSATGMAVNLVNLLYGGTLKMRLKSSGEFHVAGPVAIGLTTPETSLHVSHMGGSTPNQHAALTLQYSIDTPPDPAQTGGNMDQARFYLKGNKFVIVANDGGTVRYKYLDLTGTGATFSHTTTPL